MTRQTDPDRPTVVVPVADGWYAASDTHDPTVTTYWLVEGGAMRAYPPGHRWAPSPPHFDAPTREERAELRDGWYRDVYWPWKRAVAAAIAADPAAAHRRFAATYPRVELARPLAAVRRAESARQEARREFEAVWAAASVRRGASVNAVSRQQGCAWATARARIATGELLLATDPDRARRVVADHLQALLEPDAAQQMAAAIVAGGVLDTAKLVLAHLPDQPPAALATGSTFGAGCLAAAERFERGLGTGE